MIKNHVDYITLHRKKYKICFTMKSVMYVQDVYGSIERALLELEIKPISTLRYLLYSCLIPNYDFSVEEVGELMCGHNMKEIFEKIKNNIYKNINKESKDNSKVQQKVKDNEYGKEPEGLDIISFYYFAKKVLKMTDLEFYDSSVLFIIELCKYHNDINTDNNNKPSVAKEVDVETFLSVLSGAM